MIFVDTSAFLALENRRDIYHDKALIYKDDCLKNGQNFITSDYVLDESYTIIRMRAGHATAVHFGETLRRSQFIHIELIRPEIFEEAWKIFKAFSDHDFSFTDCTSFALMERLNIPTAFSFDAHFHKYGHFIIKP